MFDHQYRYDRKVPCLTYSTTEVNHAGSHCFCDLPQGFLTWLKIYGFQAALSQFHEVNFVKFVENFPTFHSLCYDYHHEHWCHSVCQYTINLLCFYSLFHFHDLHTVCGRFQLVHFSADKKLITKRISQLTEFSIAAHISICHSEKSK